MPESDSLDFKRQQYLLTTDDAKSEFLKDVLAFANTPRQSDAYILLGIEEVVGGAAIVHGIERHLDDANLQQLVNSKTNRPVRFSYSAIAFEGRNCGVVQIPIQERPRYLVKKYGNLDAHKVYTRHGSSTAEATLDEIAQMGNPIVKPLFRLHCEPRINRTQLGYQPLEIAAWLFNQGNGTADDVEVVLEKVRPGYSIGPDWTSTTSSWRGAAFKLKSSLNPGARAFLCVVNLGIPQYALGPDQEKRLRFERDDVEFNIKVFARDQAPVDLAISFTREEVGSLRAKEM